MYKIQNYIDGKNTSPSTGAYLDNYNPALGEVYSLVPDSDERDVQDAFDAANKAFPKWSSSVEERSRLLMKVADLIDENLDRLAVAESLDNGKPLWLAKKVDIPRASTNFRFFAQAITQFSSESHMMRGAINYTLRQPIGVVGAISPWNLPLYLFTWKIAPALAAGNTLVAKPSEVTPMTAHLLSELCTDAGLPAGVLNIVHGLGPKVGTAITRHPGIKALTFTGSTRVGKEIATVASPMFKKVSLEMGGKNPNIIFGDCDYDKMMDYTIRSSFSNQGQICLCGSRILVEEKIYDKFVADFVKRTKNLIVGPPDSSETDVGAIVSRPHFEKILSCIRLAKDEGGQILTGGERVQPKGYENGWYIQPTIITGLAPDCRTNQEEIFGPVVTVSSFKTEEAALSMANDSAYGLSCTLWTSNSDRIQRMSQSIHAGIVWVNTWLKRDLRTPFGGVKQSGVGREGGLEALRFFTEPKNVCIAFDPL